MEKIISKKCSELKSVMITYKGLRNSITNIRFMYEGAYLNHEAIVSITSNIAPTVGDIANIILSSNQTPIEFQSDAIVRITMKFNELVNVDKIIINRGDIDQSLLLIQGSIDEVMLETIYDSNYDDKKTGNLIEFPTFFFIEKDGRSGIITDMDGSVPFRPKEFMWLNDELLQMYIENVFTGGHRLINVSPDLDNLHFLNDMELYPSDYYDTMTLNWFQTTEGLNLHPTIKVGELAVKPLHISTMLQPGVMYSAMYSLDEDAFHLIAAPDVHADQVPYVISGDKTYKYIQKVGFLSKDKIYRDEQSGKFFRCIKNYVAGAPIDYISPEYFDLTPVDFQDMRIRHDLLDLEKEDKLLFQKGVKRVGETTVVSDPVNDLVTGGVDVPLSAEMGLLLRQMIETIDTGGFGNILTQSENYQHLRYEGTLSANSKTINVGYMLSKPILFLDGIRIPESWYTINTGLGIITLIEIYSPEYAVEWSVCDEYLHHIKFCYPTLNLLNGAAEVKSSIFNGDVIKILGETSADDGDHRLVKCSATPGLNAFNIGNGRYLNEIPNTRMKLKLDTGGYNGTAQDLYNLISRISVVPTPVGGILMLDTNSNPAAMYTGTTWTRVYGKFLYATEQTGSLASNGIGGGSKTISVGNLPPHSHSAYQVEHSHGRGTMEITGSFAVDDHIAGIYGAPAPTGAFSAGQNVAYDADSDSRGSGRLLHFNASSSWTGSTTSVQPAIAIGSTGSGVDYMPNYYTVHMWKRLS